MALRTLFSSRSDRAHVEHSAAARSVAGAPADRLNLIIAGGQRCGTTSLKRSLAVHPEIGFIGERDLTVDGRYVGYPFTHHSLALAERDGTEAVYRAMASRLAGSVRYIAT